MVGGHAATYTPAQRDSVLCDRGGRAALRARVRVRQDCRQTLPGSGANRAPEIGTKRASLIIRLIIRTTFEGALNRLLMSVGMRICRSRRRSKGSRFPGN